jgi:hypothetical protein
MRKELLKFVAINPANDCWEWTGTKNRPGGYGAVYIDGKQVAAHRASYADAFGPIPDGMWVLHKCDNPPCVNPEHLFLGTARDNTLDSMRKGRWAAKARAMWAARSKLSDDEIRAVRKSTEQTRFLAARYGVGPRVIQRIRAGTVAKRVA